MRMYTILQLTTCPYNGSHTLIKMVTLFPVSVDKNIKILRMINGPDATDPQKIERFKTAGRVRRVYLHDVVTVCVFEATVN